MHSWNIGCLGLFVASGLLACDGKETVYCATFNEFGERTGFSECLLDAATTPDVVVEPDAKQEELDGPVRLGELTVQPHQELLRNAAGLAIDDFRTRGGVAGAEIETVPGLESFGWEETVETFRGLIEDSEVHAIVGPAQAIPGGRVLSIARQSGIPYFSLQGGFGEEFAGQEQPWGFSPNVPLDAYVTPAIMLAKQLECTDFGLIFSRRVITDWDDRFTTYANAQIDASGMTNSGVFLYDEGGANYREEFAAAYGDKSLDCMYVEFPAIGKTMKDLPDAVGDVPIRYIYSTRVNRNPFDREGVPYEEGNGQYVLSFEPTDNELLQSFIDRYFAIYGKQLVFNEDADFAALYYEGVAILLLAIEEARSTSGLAIAAAVDRVTRNNEGDLRVTLDNVPEGIDALRRGEGINFDGFFGGYEFEGGGTPRRFRFDFEKVIDLDAGEFETIGTGIEIEYRPTQ